ncbi:MAG TPA: LysR family transcriptional regulator [Gemmataceae bacterium]|nr:LysR family transcriptional regulator [Gemmataceae bacterium]
MQLESLKVFCDIARCRSFSQAAAENGLTQSAASQIVLQLEKRLGVQLISRSPRPLQLTPLGRSYYDGCRKVIEQYQELEASIRNALADLETTVRVAAIYSVGLGDMGQLVQRFAELQPNAHVHIEYLHPDRVLEQVHDGTADFGLVSFPRKSRELTALPWRDEEMVLACHPDHPLGRNLAVTPAMLEGQRFVGFARGLVIRREVDRFLRDQGVSVDVALEFDSIENIKKAVEVAQGLALLPVPTIRREVKARTLVALPLVGCRLVRPLGIIYRRHHPPNRTAQKFVELLRQPVAAAAETRTRSNGVHGGRNGAPRKVRSNANLPRD